MTSCPATVHFRFYPYASFTATTVLQDSSGDPVDLSGYKALMHIRREVEDEVPLFELSSESSPTPEIELGGATGAITLKLSPEQTAEPSVQSEGEMWFHDLLLESPSGQVDRTYQGTVVVVPAITRGTP